MPRTTDRRSPSAAPVVPRASSRSCRAASGSCSIRSETRPRFMPRATRRAWAPSCRSRSIRRSSDAEWSTVSARDVVRSATRCASRVAGSGARTAASIRQRSRTTSSAYRHQRTATAAASGHPTAGTSAYWPGSTETSTIPTTTSAPAASGASTATVESTSPTVSAKHIQAISRHSTAVPAQRRSWRIAPSPGSGTGTATGTGRPSMLCATCPWVRDRAATPATIARRSQRPTTSRLSASPTQRNANSSASGTASTTWPTAWPTAAQG